MSVDSADWHREISARRTILESPPGLLTTRRAVAYAARLHAGQRRASDGAPFIVHPLEVACLLYDANARDEVVAAGVLHDIIEKTDADAGELGACFGPAVARLVLAVTEDPQIIGYDARKAALCEQVATAGRDAQMVFAADKISKVRELGRVNVDRTAMRCHRPVERRWPCVLPPPACNCSSSCSPTCRSSPCCAARSSGLLGIATIENSKGPACPDDASPGTWRGDPRSPGSGRREVRARLVIDIG